MAHFGPLRLDEITAAVVDQYRAAKLKEGRLGANGVNKTLVRLSQILEVALEYELVERNHAKGRNRRAKSTKPKRSWLEVEQVPSFLAAAGPYLRPLVATLLGTGLRIGEACALDWSDINLPAGELRVRESKTAQGEGRSVDIPVGLLEELAAWKARSPRRKPSDPVFISARRNGRFARQTTRNAQARFRGIVKRANLKLRAAGIATIDRATPHSCRRTYASIRAAAGDDVVYIAKQLGQTDPKFTFEIYQRATSRRGKLSDAHLEQFDEAMEWANFAGADVSAQAPDRAPH